MELSENRTEPAKLPLEGWQGPGAAPLEIDMGCHKGLFLVEMAQRFPERNFLGIERQSERVERARKKIERLGLSNARVARAEGREALAVFPEASADVIHVLFPDPWPKRRHHIRRLVQEEFLFQCARALKTGGLLRLVTDDSDYARAMQQAAARCPGWYLAEPASLDGYPATEFQKKFQAQNLPVHALHLRRTPEDLEKAD